MLRDVVYELSNEHFRAFSVSFAPVRLRDATVADGWCWPETLHQPSWEWRRLYRDYNSHRGIKRFELALHHQGKLAGLCYGIPSRRKLILKLHALAGAPDGTLKGLRLRMMLYAANAYARLLNARELWICNPMNSHLVSLYEQAGFLAHFDRTQRVTHLSRGSTS